VNAPSATLPWVENPDASRRTIGCVVASVIVLATFTVSGFLVYAMAMAATGVGATPAVIYYAALALPFVGLAWAGIVLWRAFRRREG
jgi:hypothetical protein